MLINFIQQRLGLLSHCTKAYFVTSLDIRDFCYIMRGKIKVMLLICSALLMLGCANPALEHLEQGYTYADQEQWDEAIVQYTKAIELDPELARAYNNRGWAYGEKGQSDLAIADYNKAIELDPELAMAYSNRGNTYFDKGEIDNAIADYSRTIELDPNYALAYYNRGTAYYIKDEFDRAIADYTKAIELDNAIADFDKVIEVSTNPGLLQAAMEAIRVLEGQ